MGLQSPQRDAVVGLDRKSPYLELNCVSLSKQNRAIPILDITMQDFEVKPKIQRQSSKIRFMSTHKMVQNIHNDFYMKKTKKKTEKSSNNVKVVLHETINQGSSETNNDLPGSKTDYFAN